MKKYTFALFIMLPTLAFAGTSGDWFASLYTGDGVEVKADERLFTLFALFNGSGYDSGPAKRREPFYKPLLHPVRQSVRARVFSAAPEIRKEFDTFVEAHPRPMREYVAYALSANFPGFASSSKSAEFKNLDALMQKAWTGWKLDQAFSDAQAENRAAIVPYLSALDAALAKARQGLGVKNGAANPTVVVNLLDAHQMAWGVSVDKDVYVVVGPSETSNVEGAVREYVRAVISPSLAKIVSQWSGGAALLKEAQTSGATDATTLEYAGSLLAMALALKSTDANDATYDAWAARGYFGLREIAKMYDAGRPVDSWALEALQKAETRRLAK